MMDQTIVNWLLGGFGALLGFMLKVIWQAVKDLQAADKQLSDEVSTMKVLVAGDYVRKDYLEKTVAALFSKLDRIEERIEDKLARKADKP